MDEGSDAIIKTDIPSFVSHQLMGAISG